MDEKRGPDELAMACRLMAKDMRENSHECQRMMSSPAYREGRAQLMEEIAAVLESPSVVSDLKALKIILRGISE